MQHYVKENSSDVFPTGLLVFFLLYIDSQITVKFSLPVCGSRRLSAIGLFRNTNKSQQLWSELFAITPIVSYNDVANWIFTATMIFTAIGRGIKAVVNVTVYLVGFSSRGNRIRSSIIISAAEMLRPHHELDESSRLQSLLRHACGIRLSLQGAEAPHTYVYIYTINGLIYVYICMFSSK